MDRNINKSGISEIIKYIIGHCHKNMQYLFNHENSCNFIPLSNPLIQQLAQSQIDDANVKKQVSELAASLLVHISNELRKDKAYQTQHNDDIVTWLCGIECILFDGEDIKMIDKSKDIIMQFVKITKKNTTFIQHVRERQSQSSLTYLRTKDPEDIKNRY